MSRSVRAWISHPIPRRRRRRTPRQRTTVECHSRISRHRVCPFRIRAVVHDLNEGCADARVAMSQSLVWLVWVSCNELKFGDGGRQKIKKIACCDYAFTSVSFASIVHPTVPSLTREMTPSSKYGGGTGGGSESLPFSQNTAPRISPCRNCCSCN